jgi:hypothetical protein
LTYFDAAQWLLPASACIVTCCDVTSSRRQAGQRRRSASRRSQRSRCLSHQALIGQIGQRMGLFQRELFHSTDFHREVMLERQGRRHTPAYP